MSPSAATTQAIVLTRAALTGKAWEALLARQPGLAVCALVTSADELRTLRDHHGRTAVLADLPEPLLPQIDQITSAVPNYGVLCLTDDYDLTQIVGLLQHGVAGVVSRHATVTELVRGLIAVARHEVVLPPAIAPRALAALARGELSSSHPAAELTDREREVLALLAKGHTNKDIAQALFLSVRTVEAHLRNIYGKLDVATRTEAVLWAVQHGFS